MLAPYEFVVLSHSANVAGAPTLRIEITDIWPMLAGFTAHAVGDAVGYAATLLRDELVTSKLDKNPAVSG
ncbi:hypothetical protein [Variovorax boronicumulans]|uniref:hypothetical protein n=1 Tax=Variovorax boronicumulans TaxID=436515 RepID=UPI003395E903